MVTQSLNKVIKNLGDHSTTLKGAIYDKFVQNNKKMLLQKKDLYQLTGS